jgi:hypothetical protein
MKSILTLSILLCLISCNSAKHPGAGNKKQKESSNSVLSDTVFRFGVSFISIGRGTDKQAKKEFNEFIQEFNATNKVNLKVEIINWGREGEVDYCFGLNELDVKSQADFISQVKGILGNSSLVKCYENETCKHPRKG